MGNLGEDLILLFVLAIPIACISWTVTYEELFREPRRYCAVRSVNGSSIFERKFFYAFTCEYCFSHYVTIIMLVITNYQLAYDDWRGYLIGGFALVWIANVYMTLYKRIRINIKRDKTEIELEENKLKKLG